MPPSAALTAPPADTAASAGARLAERIAADVAAAKAQPGTVLASEQDLRALHDAGRSVFRQAVRILEARGVAYMRRGHGGGLIVAEPNADFAARGLSIVAASLAADMDDLGLALRALQSHIFITGTPRLTAEACAQVRRVARELDALPPEQFLRAGAHRRLHKAIHTATGEPAVLLCHTAETEFGIDLIPYGINVTAEGDKYGEPWRINVETAEAMAAGDIRRILRCRDRMLAFSNAHRAEWSGLQQDALRPLKLDDPSRPELEQASSRAERLTREILREIRALGWRTGERIGGLAELMDRYGASTNIVRQAVRILEEHNAVQIQRGRAGGLFVATPDRRAAMARAAQFLDQSRADPADVRDLLRELALEASDVATPAALRALWAAPRGPTLNVADLLADIVAASGNAIAEVFCEALLPCARRGAHELPTDVARAHLSDRDAVDRRRTLLILAEGLDPASQQR